MQNITTTPGTVHEITDTEKVYFMGEVIIGRRTFQGFQAITHTHGMKVRQYLVGSDGSEWSLDYSPRSAGQGVFHGDYVAVNRETGKKLQAQGKVARFYVHAAKISLGL